MTYDTDGAAGNGGAEPETTDSLKAFGEVVKAFRKRANLTQEEFAHVVGYSVPTVASIEQGRRFPSASFVERTEEVLDAFGTIRGAAKHLSRRPGLAKWFRQWAHLEETAISLYTYECRLIPGLLQTEAYARTLFNNQLPPMADAKVDELWEGRALRQRLLHERPNTAFSFILEEHLFRRHTGGKGTTRGLIDRILTLATQRNIEVQIMPLERATHAGMAGPMQLLETPENKQQAYCEGQRGGLLVTEPNEVSVLHMRYARMRSQALTLEQSLSLLQRMRGEA